MRYLSICSGIEAASVAWKPLGFTAAGFSEIDPFASAVLAARFGSNLPGEPLSHNAPPNFGDFTAIDLAALGPVDLLVGGTPCQAFSFAGKRLSLADARGNLTLAFAVLAHELARSHGLRNALWENVPGVLSTPDNAFGCFLGAIVGADDALLPSERPRRGRSTAVWRWVEAGRWPVLDDNGEETGEFIDRPEGHVARWPRAGMVAGPLGRAAWRVLDAQYFGLAQRRERVFVVVDFGNGADPAAVLFEPQGLQGNSPPRREAGEVASGTVTASNGGCSGKDGIDGRLAYGGGNRSGPVDVAATLTAKGQRIDFEVETFIAGPAHTLRGEGFDASEDGTGRGTPIVPVALRGHSDYGDGLPCLRAEGGDAGGGSENPDAGPDGIGVKEGVAYTLEARATAQAVAYGITADALDRQGEGAGGTAGERSGLGISEELSPTIRAKRPNAVASGWAVRRLTEDECARLQGFPDGHSRIPWRGRPAEECPSGPQYKTYGNSMAVNVMRWLGERLAANMPEAA